MSDAGPARFWKDYSYLNRARPIGVTHCQPCHDRLAAIAEKHAANGGTTRGYSVKLRPSERARCACGATQPATPASPPEPGARRRRVSVPPGRRGEPHPWLVSEP